MITYKFSGSVENCTDRGINEENSDRNNDDSGSDVSDVVIVMMTTYTQPCRLFLCFQGIKSKSMESEMMAIRLVLLLMMIVKP